MFSIIPILMTSLLPPIMNRITMCFRALALRVTAGHPTSPFRHRTRSTLPQENLGPPLIILKTLLLIGTLLLMAGDTGPTTIVLLTLLEEVTVALPIPLPLLITANILVTVGVRGGGGVINLGRLATGTLTLRLNMPLATVLSTLTSILCPDYLNVMNTKISITIQFISS